MASTSTLQARIEECQGLVRSLAARIRRKLPPHIDLDDLVAYGQIGLAEAARDYDPAQGSRFATYAYYRIRGAIYDGLAKMSWFTRAEHSRRRLEGSRPMAHEVLSVAAENGRGGDEWLVDSSTPTPPAAAIQHEVNQRLHELIGALPEDAGQLICDTYFGGLDLQTAGRRLGISKSWASRLHAKTLKGLARDRRLSGSVIEDEPCQGLCK